VWYQATPYHSDQDADLGRHVGDLDEYMTVDYLQTIEDVHNYRQSCSAISVKEIRSYRGRSRAITPILLALTTQILIIAQARIVQGKVACDNPCTPSSNNSDPSHRSSSDRTGKVACDNPCTPSSNNSDPGHRSSSDRTGEGRVR
jgi:hypothetical protein